MPRFALGVAALAAALLLPDGRAAAPPAPMVRAPQPLPPPPPATPVKPVKPVDADFRKSAVLLDSELRRWLRDHGVARRDGAAYSQDIAGVLLYAAQRGDRELYLQLLPAAQAAVMREDEGPYTRGFVTWRRRQGTRPEISGAREALLLARALSEGARAFARPADRQLALTVLDGYARHAFELQGIWLVRKYFAIEGGGFVGLSHPSMYHPDFIDAAAAELPLLREIATRSYAMIERTQAPSGLLYPVIQPEVGATYPSLGVAVFAPNGIASLEESCAGAEGVQRGRPRIARAVLDFALARSHRNRAGHLYAYFDVRSGAPFGDGLLSGTGYACLARLAVALGHGGAVERLAPRLREEMQGLGEAPQNSEAPLGGAGPMLTAAHLLGAFN